MYVWIETSMMLWQERKTRWREVETGINLQAAVG